MERITRFVSSRTFSSIGKNADKTSTGGDNTCMLAHICSHTGSIHHSLIPNCITSYCQLFRAYLAPFKVDCVKSANILKPISQRIMFLIALIYFFHPLHTNFKLIWAFSQQHITNLIPIAFSYSSEHSNSQHASIEIV